MFYAITRINYQFKRSELKNVQKLVKQTFFYKKGLEMNTFVQPVK